MKKLFTLFTLTFFLFTACDEDDNTTPVVDTDESTDSPQLVAPGAVVDVQVGTAVDIKFSGAIPGGFKSAEWAATGGTAAQKAVPNAGATDGTFEATFTAGTTAGAGKVTLTVTDAKDKSSTVSATINVTTDPAPVNYTGFVTTQTWKADRIHILNNKVVVKSGNTLTIEAGAIVKGSTGTGSLASALVVERGGKLIAEGTADKPIVFTGTSDNIKIGEKMGTNLTVDDAGLWGGILILGKAKISASDSEGKDINETQIEGIPASDTYGLYGGSDDTDNSGTLKYVSIRHGGALIGEGNEINGLTLGGVGSGTKISYVEVVSNKDDGIEFFGGAVDCDYCLTTAHDDDGIDIDQSYSGKITNALVVQGAGSDHALEIDGPEGSMVAGYTLDVVTLIGIGGTAKSEIADFRKKAVGSNKNIYASNFPPAGDGDISLSSGSDGTYAANTLTFDKWEVKLNAADSDILNICPEIGGTRTMLNNASGSPAITAVTTATVGTDLSGFDWTWTKAKGLIN